MAPFLRPGIRVDADDLDEMPLMDSAPTDSAGSMPGCIAIVIVGVHHELIKDDRGGRATFCGQSLLVSRCGSTSISRDPEGRQNRAFRICFICEGTRAHFICFALVSERTTPA